jgi:hypothetical protein
VALEGLESKTTDLAKDLTKVSAISYLTKLNFLGQTTETLQELFFGLLFLKAFHNHL